jgi:hypothetical protein
LHSDWLTPYWLSKNNWTWYTMPEIYDRFHFFPVGTHTRGLLSAQLSNKFIDWLFS